MNMPAMLDDAGAKHCLRTSVKEALGLAEADGPKQRAAVLRLLNCAIRERDIRAHQKDECKGCDNKEIMGLILSMVDKREQALRDYEEEGQVERAEQEREEIEILREFLPRRLPEPVVERAAEEVVAELGARSIKDMGRCVTELKSRFPDQIDSPSAKKAVKKLLM